MEILNAVLPVLLYTFGIILLIVLIILGIRMIQLLDKVDKLTDDVSNKVSSLDNLFTIIDKTADGISQINDKIVNCISSFLLSLFSKIRKVMNDGK